MTAKVAELMPENQQQLMQELSSLLKKLSDQTSSSNEQQLSKISGIIATRETPKFKKKSNEELPDSHKFVHYHWIRVYKSRSRGNSACRNSVQFVSKENRKSSASTMRKKPV